LENPMKTRLTLITALTAGAALTLAGCGSSFEDSRDLYEELRVEIGCDTVDSDDFDSYMEGEVADGFPAFDIVEGECTSGDEDFSIIAVVPHDVKGTEFLDALQAEDTQAYGVDGGKWVVLVDGTDEEDLEFAQTVKDTVGGSVVELTESGVEKV